MQVQKRTDTSFANPVMGRRELTLRQQSHRERVHGVKSMLDTRPPPAQPHLTLYGRDYAAKKKATTEAAFMDLKMIQAIARTMTRKTEVEHRKGPVSLNADARKTEIYRVMHENHRLLDAIEGCEPMMKTKDLVQDHKEKYRYVINASHTMRLSGEYDMEMSRIKREDSARFDMKRQSTESRLMASKMRNTTGSVSLPSLTGPARSDPGQSQLAPLSQSAGPVELSGASGSRAPKGKTNQGEVKPSPGPPPPRRDPASSSTDSKPAKSAPKRESRKKKPEPTAVAEDSERQTAVRFDTELEDAGLVRKERRSSTPHPGKIPLLEEDEEMPPKIEEREEYDEVEEKSAPPPPEKPPAVEVEEEQVQEKSAPPVEEPPVVEVEQPPAELTAPELEAPATQEEEEPESDEEALNEAIAAVDLAEHSTQMDHLQVVSILQGALKRPSTCRRVSCVLNAHGWNGSGFGADPNLQELLKELQHAKAELHPESPEESRDPSSEPAKQDAFEDEYEDEFIDASAESLNMSRTLKSQDNATEAFEESATFEEHDG